ncbi:MAG: spore maturation protein [Bacteroidia bacterium]|jgi:spore maturation protein SpmA|nr:spore maturation protein [Bacteroidia bacterium]
MALSRFWTYIIIISVTYILVMLATGNVYTLSGVINGKQNDPLVVAEYTLSSLNDIDTLLAQRLTAEKMVLFSGTDSAYHLTNTNVIQVVKGSQPADGIFQTCKNTMFDLWLPLIGYLTFFCGLLNLLNDSNATTKLAKLLTPVFARIFPDLPKGHPAYGYMTMNFAANFLGLDNAATPFGLKAMESMQEVNKDKDVATNSQIMFLCLHAAGLTLIPTSIIGYRAAQGAANPADIMIPTIITSFIGTLAALVFVSIKQRINLINPVILLLFSFVGGLIGLAMYYISGLEGLSKIHFTGNLSNVVLLLIILLIVFYSVLNEKIFTGNQTNIFDSFIHGAKDGFTTGVRVLPYMVAMLVALSIFRNSGLMLMVMNGLTSLLSLFGVDEQIINAIPVALMRPFSAGGSRGFMLDAMKTFGPDSLSGRLSCLFQGAAETTFYVVALYFGSVQVKNSRYALSVMLLVDFVCVITSIIVCKFYF